MFINNHSISPSNVVRGEGAWADSLDLITKLCKRPLIIGRSSSTKKIRTSFKKRSSFKRYSINLTRFRP